MSDLLSGLNALITAEGPFIWAAGNIARIKKDFPLAEEQNLGGLDGAISMAYPLPADALEGIKDRPTVLYKHIYRQVNNLLDRTALKAATYITERGARAIPVPASAILDWEKMRAHLSHRQVAVHLDLGWYGRNNLLTTRRYGCKVRLVTILHDQPLDRPGPEAGGPLGCGSCRACAAACPVQAIHQGPEDFDRAACFPKVKEFEKLRGIGQQICGICVRACPGPGYTGPGPR